MLALRSPSPPPEQRQDFGMLASQSLSPEQRQDFGMLTSRSPSPEQQQDFGMLSSLSPSPEWEHHFGMQATPPPSPTIPEERPSQIGSSSKARGEFQINTFLHASYIGPWSFDMGRAATI